MTAPQIDHSALPALDTQTAMFGSMNASPDGFNDKIVAIMVYVYDVA